MMKEPRSEYFINGFFSGELRMIENFLKRYTIFCPLRVNTADADRTVLLYVISDIKIYF